MKTIKITDALLEAVKEMYDFDLDDNLTVTKIDDRTISLVSEKNNFTLPIIDSSVIECWLLLKD